MLENYSGDFFSGVLNSVLLMGALLFVARIFMATVFLIFGIYKIVNNAQMRGYMEAHRVPGAFIFLAILVQVGGGLLVVLGYQTRLAALMLAGFCILAPLLFHSDFKNPAELPHFTKDFAIAGGFLFMFAFGPGPWSLDAHLHRVRSSARQQIQFLATSDTNGPAKVVSLNPALPK